MEIPVPQDVSAAYLADVVRAFRMYKSLGFVEEARLRDRSFIEGHFVEHVVMSITREEFAHSLES